MSALGVDTSACYFFRFISQTLAIEMLNIRTESKICAQIWEEILWQVVHVCCDFNRCPCTLLKAYLVSDLLWFLFFLFTWFSTVDGGQSCLKQKWVCVGGVCSNTTLDRVCVLSIDRAANCVWSADVAPEVATAVRMIDGRPEAVLAVSSCVCVSRCRRGTSDELGWWPTDRPH